MESTASPHCDSEEEVFWGPITAREIELIWRRKKEAEKKRAAEGALKSGVEEFSTAGSSSDCVAEIEDLKNLSLSENHETRFNEIIPSDLKFIDDEEDLSVTEPEGCTGLGAPRGESAGHYYNSKNIIIVSDYSIISSDGESGGDDPKTYTVLKPLVEERVGSDDAYNGVHQDECVSVPKPQRQPVSVMYAERVTVIDDSDAEFEKDRPEPSKTTSAPGDMSPGMFSVTSGEQYFDADGTAFKDCSVSSAEGKKSFQSLKETETNASDSLLSFRTVCDNLIPESDQRETLVVTEEAAKSSGCSSEPDEVVCNPERMEISEPSPQKADTPRLEIAAGAIPETSGTDEVKLDFATLCQGNAALQRTPVFRRADMRYREPKNSPLGTVNTPSPVAKRPKMKPSRLPYRTHTATNSLLKPATLVYPAPEAPVNKKSSKPSTPVPVAKQQPFKKPLPLAEISAKKTERSKLTPSKSPAAKSLYKNVKSPVAGYINSSSSPVIIKKVLPSPISNEKFNDCIKHFQGQNPNSENIDSTNINTNTVVNSLKPVCHILSDKALIVEKVVKTQLPKMGKTQQKILCTSSSPVPKVIMHKGSITNPITKKVEEKLVSLPKKERSQMSDLDQNFSYANIPNIKQSDISVLETYKYDTDLKK